MFGLILVAILTIAFGIYFAISRHYKQFSRHGVIGPKAKFPYGNTKDGVKGKRNITYDIDDIYR